MVYLQDLKNFPKNYTKPNRTATILRYRKDLFKRRNILKWTTCNDKRKFCVNYLTDTHKLSSVVNHYRINTYTKILEKQLKMTEYGKLFFKRVGLMSFIALVFKQCIELDGTTVHYQNKLRHDWLFSFK